MPDQSHKRSSSKACRRVVFLLASVMVAWSTCDAAWQFSQTRPRGIKSPLTSIEAIVGTHSEQVAGLVTIRGTVTHLGSFVTLQDQTGAIKVIPFKNSILSLGDEAEAIGTDSFQEDSHTIVNARVMSLWRSSPPPPLALTPDEAADGEHNDHLVQVQGKLLRVDHDEGSTRLQMEGDHQFFSVESDDLPSGPDGRFNVLKPNSVLRLTGVLSVFPKYYSTSAGSFRIYLRSPADVSLVSGPPWGTVDHIVELLVVLILCAVLIQVVHVRSVERQFAAILEERARIARDIHDTLAQGFAGIAMQLEVVKSSLMRDHSLADEHLRTALGMVRHSRAEAHRSIATLRAFSSTMRLDGMLGEMVTSLSSTSPTKLHLEASPPLRHAIPQDTAEQLFRICQEALANCMQHAHARNAWVQISESDGSLELRVRDDGNGFDPDRVVSSPMIHFGLMGMRERVSRIKGHLTIDSGAQGTSVHVRVGFAGARPGFFARTLRRRQLMSAIDHKTEGVST